jgi:hypothetical protein
MFKVTTKQSMSISTADIRNALRVPKSLLEEDAPDMVHGVVLYMLNSLAGDL